MKINPFTLSPNPAWFYLTPSTLSSIETIRWMVDDQQGLAAIFAPPGFGKSTILRLLVSEYADESLYRTAYLTRVDFNTAYAFVKKICADFDIDPRRSLAAQNDALEEFLYKENEAGRTVILFLDEAQALTPDLLEAIRGLLNFETNSVKLLNIVVAGQLNLLDRIRQKRNKALASRVFSPVILQALGERETVEMIEFRCSRARVPCPFTPAAMSRIYSHTGGNPRTTLWICARATKQFPDAMIQPNHIDLTVQRVPQFLEGEWVESKASA